MRSAETERSAIDDFETLTRESARQIRGAIARLIRNEADIDDAMQETYLAAWRARGSFDGRASVRTWLHRIAINTSLNVLRRRRSTRVLLERDLGDDESRSLLDRVVVDEVATKRELAEWVWSHVESLPDDVRLVLVLKDIEGLSSDEIASQLSITNAAVRQRLHRARKMLARAMHPELSHADVHACGGRLDVLLDYLDRALPPEQARLVADHVRHCPGCHQLRDAYDHLVHAVRRAAADADRRASPPDAGSIITSLRRVVDCG